MKKFLLSCAAVLATLSASAVDWFVPVAEKPGHFIISQESAETLRTQSGYGTMSWNTGVLIPKGVVILDNELMTVAGENDVNFLDQWAQGSAVLKEHGLVENYINLGIQKTTLDNNFKAEEFNASEYGNLNLFNDFDGQTMLKVTAKINGVLGFNIANNSKGEAGKTRSFAILTTVEKEDPDFGEIYTCYQTVAFMNTADADFEITANVEAGKSYWIIAAGQNHTLYGISFVEGGAVAAGESWSVGQAIATVEPEFNGNQTADAEAKLMTVADGSAYIYGQTENVKITYRSTPNGKAADSPSGNDSDLDQCLAGKKTWVDLRANGSGNQIWDETFTHCIMGRGNPSISRTYWYEQTNDGIADRVDETFYEPTCGKLPVVGTYIEVEVATAGTMEAVLMVWRPKNALYIIDESTTKPLAPEAVSFTGWYNNNTLEPIEERTLDENYLPSRDGDPGKQFAGNFKFSLNAGKYMILSPKSQIGLYGYKFTPGPSTAIENVETVAPAVKSNAIYNLAGQVVDESYKGIVIKNGKKYLMK